MGLAGAALLTTTLTAGLFYRQMRRDFFGPTLGWPPAALAVLAFALPLMINGLVNLIFFRFDQFIIFSVQGPDASAIYEAAYKFINFTMIITPSVTLALFPGMAHAAVHDRPALRRQYRSGLKVLLLLALPLVAGTVALAPLLITVLTLGKGSYLPSSAWALQILIWFLPFSFVNGLTQYVLIALDRQRWLTWAFLATALFNVGANLVLVPIWGIYGAAAVTVLSVAPRSAGSGPDQ
jgi:O-antigen/teichoic acid export membrane protein